MLTPPANRRREAASALSEWLGLNFERKEDMVLRWKKDPKPTGLARVCAGPQGSTLRIDGDMRVATVRPHGRDESRWFWVAGWGHPNIPHKNTSEEPLQTEAEAKAAAMAYVREFLKPNVEVTGAARLYRAASVWTAGLDHCYQVSVLVLSLKRAPPVSSGFPTFRPGNKSDSLTP